MRPPDLTTPPTPETLRELRQRHGYTVRDLSRETGLAYGHLAEVHQGRRRPGLHVTRTLAALYGLTVGELCEMTPEQARKHTKAGPAQQAPPTSRMNQDRRS